MTISMYDVSVPGLVHSLKSLRALLEKGAAHAAAKQFDANVLAASRLAPDMFPLGRQVQIATDIAKSAAARLAGIDPPKWEDTETTLPELMARIDKAVDYLQSFKPEQIDGSETRTITVTIPRATLSFTGLAYLRHWVMPNFYFHATTTYALLRHNGVELGKADFLGPVQ